MTLVGYRLNRLDEPAFMAVSKPLLTEFGIHYRLESCGEGIFPASSIKAFSVPERHPATVVVHVRQNVSGEVPTDAPVGRDE